MPTGRMMSSEENSVSDPMVPSSRLAEAMKKLKYLKNPRNPKLIPTLIISHAFFRALLLASCMRIPVK